MELVEGETLRGPLPMARALLYAGQILEALEAAHRKGIVHRDLKPANVMVSKTGVKLLDFGLAQVKAPATANDQTATMALSTEGAIAGTLQYMAPEQLQGKQADGRSDIFAFGLTFYEMLTGRKAFDGDNAASVISAIMTAEPPALPQQQLAAHPALDRVLRACIAKDPDERWQSASDVRRALELVDPSPVSAEAAPHRKGFQWGWMAAAVVGVHWWRRHAMASRAEAAGAMDIPASHLFRPGVRPVALTRWKTGCLPLDRRKGSGRRSPCSTREWRQSAAPEGGARGG